MKTKILTILFLAALIFTFGAGIARAQDTPTAEKLWENIMKINPGLKDYSVDLYIKVSAKYQIFSPKLNLDGTYYFKKPDKHKLKLRRASYFLNKYPKIFGWSLPALKEFNSKVESVTMGGKDYFKVTLTPKTIAGDVAKEEIWIDKENYTFPRHIYYYKGGGLITLNIDYRKVKEFLVFNRMQATFKFPKEKLEASADARYGVYKMNIGLSDDFFKDDGK